MKKIFYLMLSAAFLSFVSCNKEDDVKEQGGSGNGYEIDGKDYTVHNFVFQTFGTYYYWADNVPNRMNFENCDTPYDVLESFREKTDRFSAVVNNYSEVEKSFDNDYKTDGTNYDLFLADENSSNIVAVLNYVYDNSPASKAGLKRGDVITAVNGQTLTKSNYSTLLNENVCTYTYKKVSSYTDDEGKVRLDWKDSEEFTTEPVTKTDMKIDPVLQVKTFNVDGKIIGYFLYDSFTQDTKTIMDAVEKLQAAQVTDLVLDLRLNGGGYVSTLDTLASMLVPDGNEGKVFLRTEYNSLFAEYLKREDPDYDKEYFVPISPKLNLSTLYVLISGSTASASEELISGLSPYLKVVLIGEENSYGKFTSNILVNDDEDKGSDEDGTPYSEWAAYVSIACCKNANNEMKFADGFEPDYYVRDVYYELGDTEEPLLNAAVSMITGKTVSKKAAAPLFGKFVDVFGKPEITRAAMICKPNYKKR